MGSLYVFSCQECDYSAEVSGGPDYGFMAQTQTMVCTPCRAVVDVIVGNREPKLISEDELNKCPECEGKDLKPWDEAHHCPRCKGTMNKNPDEPTTMWD